MSGAWESMLADEEATKQILADHHADLTKLEDFVWRKYGIHRFGESFKQGARQMTNVLIPWLLHLQRRVDELTVAELVAELRKEAGSVYWPLYEADPKFWGDCDRCRTRQLFDARGLCDGCGAEVET